MKFEYTINPSKTWGCIKGRQTDRQTDEGKMTHYKTRKTEMNGRIKWLQL
jgi:hypothetical protein